MRGYESFKFENTLIGVLYPTSKFFEDTPSTEQEACNRMVNSIAGSTKYFYHYSEYMFARVARFLFCCACTHNFRWYNKLKRHEAARDRLRSEIDIIKLLHSQRVSAFMAEVVLKKHQRALV